MKLVFIEIYFLFLCLPNDLFGVILTPHKFQKNEILFIQNWRSQFVTSNLKLLKLKEGELTVPDEVLLTKI